MRRLFIGIFMLVSSGLPAEGQLSPQAGAISQTTLSLDSVIAMSLRQHPRMLAAEAELKEQKALKRGSFNLDDPQIMLEAPTGDFFTPGVQQSFDNPLVYIQQSKVGKRKVALAEVGIAMNKSEVIRQVSIMYNQLQYAKTSLRRYFLQDSIFNALYRATEKRYSTGDAGVLEKTSAQARAQESALLFAHAKGELSKAKQLLALLTGLDTSAISLTELVKFPAAAGLEIFPSSSPFTNYAQQNLIVASQQLKLARAEVIPGFSVGYMNQAELTSEIIQRFQFGLSFPLWFWTHSSRIKSAKANSEKANHGSNLVVQNFNIAWLDAITAYQKNLSSVQYYENTGLEQSEIMLDAANLSHSAGEIGYIEYLLILSQSFRINAGYDEALKNYNDSIIELNYLKGNVK